jgi:uncharacterized membrane protein
MIGLVWTWVLSLWYCYGSLELITTSVKLPVIVIVLYLITYVSHTHSHTHTPLFFHLLVLATRHSRLSSLVSRLSSLSLAPSTRLSPSYSVEFTN